MKPFYLFSSVTLFGATARKVIQATALLFLFAMVSLGGLSSCQRTSQAYFAPTHHPAPQRIATSKPGIDPSITASLDDDVPLPTKPGWLETESPGPEPVSEVTRSMPVLQHHSKRAVARRAVPPACDQIVLRNGDVIEAKIKEVGVQEIKYKKCDRPDGPDYTISKRDVLSIKYSTGDVERFNAAPATSSNSSGSRASYDSPTNGQADGPRTDPFAIVAVATGGLAILTGYGAFLLGAAAIVFGALSLSRIRKEPGRFKGRGLAIGGMVAGLVSAGLILLYILL
ncbi:DUF4190 domain-containing protein [Spirosoma utsteinense]|uniref:DUF4190 domain-containing protein n=1 Tax=Spirosoma utsteinense TaxID=2585773 RepID=A0ABR6WAK6_9BACT|nr:DUF4190 domain-containing protein [Spirosoma utsteinense]MBC3787254.1 hypothetical protein [Spirosoma utsteinense]MBC3792940.1 hypothetical protein [Spirosoma utsteinense]